MADEDGGLFGGGFLDDLSSLLGGGPSGEGGDPSVGSAPQPHATSGPASPLGDDFAALLRSCEDIVNGLA